MKEDTKDLQWILTPRKYHIYHHDDMDGHASGGLVGGFLLRAGVKPEELEYYRMSYGDKFDDSKVNYEKDVVYVVDFSLQPYERMPELGEKLQPGHLIWIDHHITSENFLKEHGDFNYQGIIKSGLKAACELVWEWFRPGHEVHPTIRLTSQYDVWNKDGEYDWKEEVLPYQLYLGSIETRPGKTILWSCLTDSEDRAPISKQIKIGMVIHEYNKRRQARLVTDNAYELKFQGFNAIVMNNAERGSRQFGDKADNYDIQIVYCNQGKHWVCSLYSEKPYVHCGEIAKRLGAAGPFKSGGGHKGAAGFQTTSEHLFSLLQ